MCIVAFTYLVDTKTLAAHQVAEELMLLICIAFSLIGTQERRASLVDGYGNSVRKKPL